MINASVTTAKNLEPEQKGEKTSVGDNSFSFSSSSQSRHHTRTRVLSVCNCREHKHILISVKRHSGILGSNLNLLFKPNKAFGQAILLYTTAVTEKAAV